VDFKAFWYVLSESRELKPNTVLGRQVLDERIAVFRDEHGRAAAFQDKCLHRAGPLSRGRVVKGRLQCPYHGWSYEGTGRIVDIPSLGPHPEKIGQWSAKSFAVRELDGYVYVCLSESPSEEFQPFRMRHYGERGWRTIRLTNRFRNNVTNCVENFVDIPHTAYVHAGIFRSRKNEKLITRIARKNGSVTATYQRERANLGVFSWFLNLSGREIVHTDSFYMPNVTCVEYLFGPNRHFMITSQSVPASDDDTLVYTDLTFNYGVWNRVAPFFVRRQGQRIIDQDIEILNLQMEVIRRYGEEFSNTPADLVHVFIESIRKDLEMGRDPRLLPEQAREVEFWV